MNSEKFKLLDGKEQGITKGEYMLTVKVTSGTAKLQHYTSDLGKDKPDRVLMDLPEASFTSSDTVIITLKTGHVLPTLPAGCEMWLDAV